MTESNQGPATPGTAARDPVDLGDWKTCPCGSPAGPEFRYWLCDPCAELTPASALLRMGQLFGKAALAASKSASDIERLKAENASLMESLRAAKEAKREAENEMVAAEAQLEWLSDAITGSRPIDDFGLSFGVVREAVDLRTRAAAAEQRAEAAEKRSTDLMALARRVLEYCYSYGGDRELPGMCNDCNADRAWWDGHRWRCDTHKPTCAIGALEARAALHDEERSAPPQHGSHETISWNGRIYTSCAACVQADFRAAQGEEK